MRFFYNRKDIMKPNLAQSPNHPNLPQTTPTYPRPPQPTPDHPDYRKPLANSNYGYPAPHPAPTPPMTQLDL